MSGHSKWHNIQARKSKVDAKRAASFTKMARAILIAARHGGGNPESNFSLALAIEKARNGNLPKDKIERAIQAGTGELKGDAQIEEVMYEGFGPSLSLVGAGPGMGESARAAVLVKCATDNRNRTNAEIRRVFSDFGGALGTPGSVSWQFKEIGVVRLSPDDSKKIDEAFELTLIDNGAQDIIKEKDGSVEIRTEKTNLAQVLKTLENAGVKASGSLEWVPKEAAVIDESGHAKDGGAKDGAAHEKLEKFLEALDGMDDVQEVYINL